MKIQLLRHATFIVVYGGRRILVDPVFGAKGSRPPIVNSPQPQNNPLIELSLTTAELTDLLAKIDGVFVSHTHSDHWDSVAAEMLSKDKPLFCQPADGEKLRGQGFINVQVVEERIQWSRLTINRTGGKHGSGVIGKTMGEVSGFVMNAPGEPVLYIAGDTIWCKTVQQTLQRFQPDVAVLYAGAAQFNTGKPITMTREDVANVTQTLPHGQIVAIHMEAYNHCLLKRADLKQYLKEQGLDGRVAIPTEGQWLEFNA